MKRTGSPIIKIAAATSMVVFSLGAAFAGSAAWFNSVSSLAQDVNQMAVESLDGNFSSLKIYNSIFADKNDYYFSKTASQTIEVKSWKDFTLKDYVALTMDTYSPLDPYQPIMMVIEYTDVVGTLMSGVTNIVNTVSYVLIAFVAVSLIVSSIMIGIITYISVLERIKEIGILRAIGASKRNISEVFNAETFIIGLLSGLLGIGITYALLVPINAVIHNLTDNYAINAFLPAGAAVILVMISVILTLIGGLIPSRQAAQKDPVIALRSE